MSREENGVKVSKIFWRVLNKNLRKLNVMNIQKSKCCGYLRFRTAAGRNNPPKNALQSSCIILP